MNEYFGYIYKTTNRLNGKVYIGQKKSQKFLYDKYLGSGKLLQRAIQKYGKQNFSVSLLVWCISQQELDEKERYYIKLYNSTDTELGYNISSGGTGGKTTSGYIHIHRGDEDKLVSSTELKLYLDSGFSLGMSEHSKANIGNAIKKINRSGIKNPFYGKKHTKETKLLIGQKSKGRGTGENNVSKRPEVRYKISQYAKNNPNNYFKTHVFHYIHKDNIERRVDRNLPIPDGWAVGRLPSCWINNGQEEKLIHTYELDKYLNSGYVKGRKLK